MGSSHCSSCFNDSYEEKSVEHVAEKVVCLEAAQPAAVHKCFSRPGKSEEPAQAAQAAQEEEEEEEDEPPPPWKPLSMTIVAARNLRNADFSVPWKRNLSDPYCICEIDGKPLSKCLTDVIADNLDPVWNHETRFRDFVEGDTFTFNIWDKDTKLKNDDFLGRTHLPSDKFFPQGFDGELELQEAGKNRRAFLKLKIEPAEREARRRKSRQERPKPQLMVHRQEASGGEAAQRQRPSGGGACYRRASKSTNQNKPSDYIWLEDCLKSLAANEAAALKVRDLQTKNQLSVALFVIGGCPNALCGMQAVMLAIDAKNGVDFWWVKPSKAAPATLERETLNRHGSGKHKNDPGRSKPFYQPLADLFQQGTLVGDWRFGILEADHSGKIAKRFVIRNEKRNEDNVYLQLLWQEDWTSNPFAYSKYIKGKFLYQKSLAEKQFYCRQYEIHDGKAQIADCEEGPFDRCIPPEDIKGLWDMSDVVS